MAVLTRDGILGAQDLGHEDYDVPEWGGAVRLRAMSGAERENLSRITDGKDNFELLCHMLAASLVDEDGALLFTAADVDALKRKNGAVVKRIVDRVLVLNGLSEEGVSELEKNFAGGPSVADGSS